MNMTAHAKNFIGQSWNCREPTKQFMTKKTLVLLSLLLLSLNAAAETYYVDDTLRVGVRAKPIKSLPSLTVVRSGDKVELLQNKGGYAKIRTSNGIEGWVKSAYLSKNIPAVATLKKSNSENEKLKNQIEDLKIAQNKKNSQDASLVNKISQLEKENSALKNQVNTASTSNDTNNIIGPSALNISLKDINKNHLYMILGAIIVLLSLGFLFGVSWHKKQVTKRLGGLSI